MTLLRIDLKTGAVTDAVTMERMGIVTATRDSDPDHVQISLTPEQPNRRRLLETFLKRLERTGALSCPPGDLRAAIDDHLNEEKR